jgi:hypothetical protein
MRCTTDDIKKVSRVLMDDSVFPYTTDDGSPSKEDFPMWPLLEDKRIYVLMPNEDSVAVAFPMNFITYDFHFNALKPSRGNIAVEAVNKAIGYMFTKTPCRKLVAQVPTNKVRVAAFFTKIGMQVEGGITKSFLKRGVLYDQIIFGLTKENS